MIILDFRGLQKELKGIKGDEEFTAIIEKNTIEPNNDLRRVINGYISIFERIIEKTQKKSFYAKLKFTGVKLIVGQISNLSIDENEGKVKFLLINKKNKNGENIERCLSDLEMIKFNENKSKGFIFFL